MSYHRDKLYQSYVASDIFDKDGRLSPERRMLDKKIRVKVKPRDLLEFRQDLAPEKGKTGKRFEERKGTSDIFFLQKKMMDNSQMTPRLRTNNSTMSLDKEAVNATHSRNPLPNQVQTAYRDMSIYLQATEASALTTRRIKVKPRAQWRSLCSIEDQRYDRLSTSRDNKINMLRSNIFFGKGAGGCPITLHKRQASLDANLNRSQEKTFNENRKCNADVYQNRKWIDGINWKDFNTEIHFKEAGKHQKNISAFERRLKENESDLSPSKTHRPTYISSLDCKNQYTNQNNCIIDKQKMRNLFSAYTSNAAKISKQFENYSCVQGNTFFEKNTSTQFKSSIDKESNQVDTYEVANVNAIQEREIQRAFNKKGIHIFEIYRKNSINSGRPLLEFKVRSNPNDKEYKAKMNQIKEEIKAISDKDSIILVKVTGEKRRDNTKVTMPKELGRPSSSLRIR